MRVFDGQLKLERIKDAKSPSMSGTMIIDVPSQPELPAVLTFKMKDRSIVRYAVDRNQWEMMVKAANNAD